jgi:hypothetical protein
MERNMSKITIHPNNPNLAHTTLDDTPVEKIELVPTHVAAKMDFGSIHRETVVIEGHAIPDLYKDADDITLDD